LVPQIAAGARGAGRLQPDPLVWIAVIGAAWLILAENTLPSGDGTRHVVAGAFALLAAGALLGGGLLTV
jgi:hypothetical protein